MSEEQKPYIIYGTASPTFNIIDNTLCSGAYNPPSYPHIMPLNASATWQPTMVTIGMYNDLLTLYMDRGSEIQRLQAVVRDAAHALRARRDVFGSLSAADTALLEELEQVLIEEKA